jgi:hypothetical protein
VFLKSGFAAAIDDPLCHMSGLAVWSIDQQA